MREVLFRGKTKNGKWVYGAFYKQKQYYGAEREIDCIITSDDVLSNDLGLDYEEVIPETVGQYTGLCDKNGTKIFEGDIVLNRAKEKCTVKYGRHDLVCCGCCYKSHESVGFYLCYGPHEPDGFYTGYVDDFAFSDDDAWKNIEVLGNIHDNNLGNK